MIDTGKGMKTESTLSQYLSYKEQLKNQSEGEFHRITLKPTG